MHILGTFQFYGPNWHTDFAACEWLVLLDKEERGALREEGETMPGRVATLLANCGVQSENLSKLKRPLPGTARARFAFLFNSVAISLQRHAGHKAYRAKRVGGKEAAWVRAIFEVEDIRAGKVAGQLALHLLSLAIPGLKFKDENLSVAGLPGELVEKYRQKFAKTALPADTRAMIRAAERAGIPWIRLDQPPFRFQRDPSGTRRSGNLLLGQGVNRHIVDGTLCLDRKGSKARPFLHDRPSIGRMLAKLGAALPYDGRGPLIARSLLEAIQITELLRYPVVLKPVRRAQGKGVTLNVRNIGDLMQSVNHAQSVSQAFLVQRHIKGPTWRIIVSNGKFVGLLRSRSSLTAPVDAHASITELAERIAHQLQVGLLVLTVVTADISKPLEVTGGAVVDLDLAPELNGFLKPNSKLWKPLMDGFIQSLYPSGAASRIPIIAVTGTSAAITARMIDAIMRQAGFDSALSGTEGLYLAGQRVKRNRSPRRLHETHHRLIRNRKVELAVMEFSFSQLQQGGFPFDWCNIGVLTQVITGAVQPGWESGSQIAETLLAALQRAREGVVLSADDPYTPDLLQRLDARKIMLTSTRQPASEIRCGSAAVSGLVTLEHGQGGGRIVISAEGKQVDLMGLDEIPATLGGGPEFMPDSVLLAIATAHLMKVSHAVIRAALSSFA